MAEKSAMNQARHNFGEVVCSAAVGVGLLSVNLFEPVIPAVRDPNFIKIRVALFGVMLFLPVDQEGHSPCYKISEYFLGDSSHSDTPDEL
ncbi:MAG: hypothetical protein RLN62_04355 [Rickettsiales bacterium]